MAIEKLGNECVRNDIEFKRHHLVHLAQISLLYMYM